MVSVGMRRNRPGARKGFRGPLVTTASRPRRHLRPAHGSLVCRTGRLAMPRREWDSFLMSVALGLPLVACGSGSTPAPMSKAGPAVASDAAQMLSPGDAQTPAMGEAATAAWLEDGAYRSWTCESRVHEGRSPSPHGFNRICSNDVISQRATAGGEWPLGAAAVKETY